MAILLQYLNVWILSVRLPYDKSIQVLGFSSGSGIETALRFWDIFWNEEGNYRGVVVGVEVS